MTSRVHPNLDHLIAGIRDPDNDADLFTATLAERREAEHPINGTPMQTERRAHLIASGTFTESDLEANTADVRRVDLKVIQVFGWVSDVSTAIHFAQAAFYVRMTDDELQFIGSTPSK